MIVIKQGTVDTMFFKLQQILDNERIALPLVNINTITFIATQKTPALNRGDPAAPKTLSIVSSIVNPVTGLMSTPVTAADTDTPGDYKCEIQIVYNTGAIVFQKYEFDMTIRD